MIESSINFWLGVFGQVEEKNVGMFVWKDLRERFFIHSFLIGMYFLDEEMGLKMLAVLEQRGLTNTVC